MDALDYAYVLWVKGDDGRWEPHPLWTIDNTDGKNESDFPGRETAITSGRMVNTACSITNACSITMTNLTFT